MDDRHIAIIPARGGSKGVPRKNLVPIGGRPLLEYTVLAAMESGVFAAVVVSTEDDEIASVARGVGASVISRPVELAQDTTQTEPVMAHALALAEEASGATFDYVWLLQPTSPLRDAADIRSAADVLCTRGVDSVIGLIEEHVFRWRTIGTAFGAILVEPDYEPACRPRRQEMEVELRETGAVYGVSRAVWNETGVRVGGRVGTFVLEPTHALDVDTLDDVAYVDWLLSSRSADAEMQHPR